jgi:hypothetical protein
MSNIGYYNRKGFALQYPDGWLVALDTSSGGYPYRATLISEVWIRDTREEMERYIQAGNSEGLKIVPINVMVEIGS